MTEEIDTTNTAELNTQNTDNSIENVFITNEMQEYKKQIKINEKNIEEVFEYIEKNQNIISYESYRIRRSNNYVSLENDNNNFEENYFFKRNLTIYYKNYNTSKKIVNLVDEKVSSTFQIKKTMELYKLDYLTYEDKKSRNFPNFTNTLLEFINNNNFVINFLCPLEELKYKYDDSFLPKIPEKINLATLSEYSNKYFKYSDEEIKYIETEERKKFFRYLNDFIHFENINLFKITGPSNDGKTLTLLLFSRSKNNIIYFNLKYILSLYHLNDTNYYKVMLYELGRANLMEDQVKDLMKLFKLKNIVHPWKLISEIIKKLENDNKIIILDQFKEKTVEFYDYDKIENEIIGKKLKIIICSSINDNMIKSKVLETIRDCRGNPTDFNEKYQKSYFYICNILNRDKLKEIYDEKKNENEYFDYFNYNPKYIYKLNKSEDKSKTLKDIEEHICEKVKESYNEKDVSAEEILYLMSRIVGKQLNYINDYQLLTFTSLKYFTLDFHKSYFVLNYSFKYIKNIVEKIELKDNIENFFQKDKASKSNFYRALQPYYYEESCGFSLQEGNLFPKDKYQINVQTIAELNEDENKNSFNRELLKEFEKEISLKEYYEMNLKTIKNIIEQKEKKKNENNDIETDDIHSFFLEELNKKKNNLETLLKKKRKKAKSKTEIEEEVDIRKKIKIYEYKDSFYNGCIFVNQTNKNGKTLDFAFLSGEKDEKNFIGFQVKIYSKETKLTDDVKKKLNKKIIKENLKNVLTQSTTLYNINIEEWHYFMISFYDPESKEYNQDIVNKCRAEGLEYMFYNPKSHYFFDKNFERIEGEIKLTFNSNLDFNKENNPEIIFENFHDINSNSNVYCKLSTFNKKLYSNANKFIQMVSKDKTLKMLNKEIREIIKGINNVKLISIFNYSTEYPFPIPNNSYLLLFISKDSNDFIYYYKNMDSFSCGYINSKEKKIKPFFISNYINLDVLNFLVYKFN